MIGGGVDRSRDGRGDGGGRGGVRRTNTASRRILACRSRKTVPIRTSIPPRRPPPPLLLSSSSSMLSLMVAIVVSLLTYCHLLWNDFTTIQVSFFIESYVLPELQAFQQHHHHQHLQQQARRRGHLFAIPAQRRRSQTAASTGRRRTSSTSFVATRRLSSVLLLSPPNNNSDSSNSGSDDGEQKEVGYDGLYEFLTSKKSNGGGGQIDVDENERKQKRILGWNLGGGSSNSSNNNGNGDGERKNSDNEEGRPVQPLRVEDGQVDEDLIQSSSSSSSSSSSTKATPQKQKARARFDKLFSGMPSLDSILSGSTSKTSDGASSSTDTASATSEDDMNRGGVSPSSSNSNSNSNNYNRRRNPRKVADDSWFDEERKQIQQEYDQILQDAKTKIQQQRMEQQQQQDATDTTTSEMDDVIPDNAEGIVESIIRQEMQRKIDDVRNERVRQRIQDYEEDLQMQVDETTAVSGSSSSAPSSIDNEVVQRILKEAAEQFDRREKLQQQQDEYEEYERQLQQQLESYDRDDRSAGTNGNTGSSTADMDEWALQRLEEMLDESRRDDGNGESENYGLVEDILEENIEDLRRRISKESSKGKIQPTTMKEWQMYRSIATRLAQQEQQQELDNDGDESNEKYDENSYNVDEDQVAQQLQSWKEYVEKEEGIRKRAGLASGPKLPFDNLGTKIDKINMGPVASESLSPPDEKKKSRQELRREINIQSIKAMEDLIAKTDAVRAASLQRELDALKAELEPRDYNDIEREEDSMVEDDMELPQPVDLREVFNRSGQEGDGNIERIGLSSNDLKQMKQVLSSNGNDSIESLSSSASFNNPSGSTPPPQPPDTPFFRDDPNIDIEFERIPPPPPNTPFFREEGGGRGSKKDDLDVDNKLGSVDEQKLQAMFRRAGARTKQDQDRIREEWEAFQAFEKESRVKSGLSENDNTDGSVPSLMNDIDTNYDISEVMKDDGDFDADKILSSIGPRPTKRSSTEKRAAEDVSAAEVADSLYRSVAAADGGRGKDDPVYKERDRAEFDEYLAKEDEMRRSLDDLGSNAAEIAGKMDITDDQSYAEDVLAASPRPVFQRQKKQAIDEKEMSDRGGILASEEDDDADAEVDDVSSEDTSPMIDDFVPGWLKKEREAAAKARDNDDTSGGFLGSEIDDAFSDDAYEHNLRQLHEYEQRRSGKKQMGIDVSDIFGKRGSDDYVDYTYDTDYFRDRQDGWGASTFEARKANLLQYIELDMAELNNLMAYKDSVYATGVSQYLPRINKPFKEFGAIFRVEGVLVDISGLQELVWKRIITEFDFKDPLSEDIRRASVTRPEIAIREILFGTNDVVLVRQVVDAYRRILREEFDKWAKKEGLVTESNPSQQTEQKTERGSLALGFEDAIDTPPPPPPPVTPVFSMQDESSRLRYLKKSWTRTAQQFGFDVPTDEQIAESAIVTPDIAIRSIFEWTDDQLLIRQIAAAHSILQAGDQDPDDVVSEKLQALMESSSPSSSRQGNIVDESTILELQFTAWKRVAEMNSLPVPDPEEILAASVLNDPEAVVTDGFGWTSDTQRCLDLANQYRDFLSESLNATFDGDVSADLLKKMAPPPTSTMKSPDSNEDMNVQQAGPTDVEILQSQVEAWKEAARIHSFDAPSADRIQMFMNMNPEDAVRQLIRMDYDIDDLTLQEVTDSYMNALQQSTVAFMKRYGLSQEIQQNQSTPAGVGSNSPPGVVSDDEIYRAVFDAWTNVAWKLGYTVPDQEQILFAMTVGPEEAIVAGFKWTDDPESARDIAKMYLDQIKLKRDDWHRKGYSTTTFMPALKSSSGGMGGAVDGGDTSRNQGPLIKITPGVQEWIQSLRAVEMGCGVVSYLEDDHLHILLEYAGLAEIFPPEVRVSHSSGYDRDSQQLLGAALRIERRPDHCVVFDTSPYSSSAAHEVEMRSVAMVGPYPRYELLAADTSASSLDELTAMNIRRLFGERVSDQPMFEQQNTQPDTTKRTKTKYKWADD